MQSRQGDPGYSDDVPAGQLKQLVPPEIEVVPNGQASHEDDPNFEV